MCRYKKIDLENWCRKEHYLYYTNSLNFIILSGFATGGSWLCFYRALQDGLASIVVPIDKLSILVTIGFSRVVFHEKLSKKALLGLILITVGTVTMTMI